VSAPPTATTYVPISEAAARIGHSYRHTRALIAVGRLQAVEVDDYEDGRVKLLVSVRSIAAFKAARRRQRSGS
jgi:hypothetical protein